MTDFFLTPSEKDTFSEWSSKDIDNSISKRVLLFVWTKLLKHLVPDTVAPNILSFGGLLCLVHAWYISYLYMDTQPKIISLAAVLLFIANQVLDGIDGKHAKNTNNDSPLGEFFAHCCSNIGFVFSTLTVCYVLGIEDLATQWYLVQIGQFIALRCHIRAFVTKVVSFSMFTGPGEGVFLLLVLMAIKPLFPSLIDNFALVISSIVLQINGIFGTAISPYNYKLLFSESVRYVYYLLFIATCYSSLSLPSKHKATRNGLLFCLCYRAIPAVLLWLGLFSGSFTILDLISQGLCLSFVTSDIILAKMANRDLHPFIVIFAMLSILNNFLILVVVGLYYLGTLYEISHFMHLSIFGVTRNVYVDGVYDMCHLGHFNSFKKALTYGTRLFVGILSDEDVNAYKRYPIMTMQERAAVVATSKYVHKVIAPAPFPGIPEEFIKKYRIHVVCHSPEYAVPGDRYYAIPRAMGITQIMPRTEGMSTTELIKRIRNYDNEDQEQQSKPSEQSKDNNQQKNKDKSPPKSANNSQSFI